MENLKNALGDELFGQVQAAIDAYNAAEEHKDTPIKLADLSGGGYVSKDKHAALEAETAGYKQQLDTLTAELQAIKEAKTTAPDAKVALEALQQKYEADTKNLQEQIDKARFDGLLGAALAGSRARSVKALQGMLDMEKLKVENGKLTGFDEQLAAIRKDAAYLFEPDGAWGQEHGGNPPAGTGVEAAFAKINPDLKID